MTLIVSLMQTNAEKCTPIVVISNHVESLETGCENSNRISTMGLVSCLSNILTSLKIGFKKDLPYVQGMCMACDNSHLLVFKNCAL